MEGDVALMSCRLLCTEVYFTTTRNLCECRNVLLQEYFMISLDVLKEMSHNEINQSGSGKLYNERWGHQDQKEHKNGN